MPSIFSYSIAYVEDINLFPKLMRDPARAASVKGLAIKLYDSEPNPVIERNLAWLRAGGVKRLRDEGFVPGVWAVPRLKPGECATVVSKVYGELGLSFCVMETEWHYKTDGGGIDVARLIVAWRKLRPKAWTGFAVEGGPPTTFNHAAVQADPYAVLCPETYQHLGYDVRACMKRCQALGWEQKRIKPALSAVEGDVLGESLVRLYRAEDVLYEPEGVLLWRGDMWTAEDFRLLGLADTVSLR